MNTSLSRAVDDETKCLGYAVMQHGSILGLLFLLLISLQYLLVTHTVYCMVYLVCAIWKERERERWGEGLNEINHWEFIAGYDYELTVVQLLITRVLIINCTENIEDK